MKMKNKDLYFKTFRSRDCRLIAISLGLLFLIGCKESVRRNPSGAEAGSGAGVVDTTGVLTSTRKAEISYARGFSIERHDHFKLVRVLNRLATTTDTLQYLLVPQGYPVPPGFPNAQVIYTPVQTIIGMSSMHIALADFAGVADRITGLGSYDYVSSPVIRNNIKAGKIKQVGLDGNMNNELIITMHPSVLIAMGNPDAGFGRYKTLIDAGIPILLNTEWLESTPLGRAEWVKLMGALVDKEELVDDKFDSIAREYQVLAKLGRGAHDRPRVIIGMPYKGSWFVPSGESYMAAFLRDAGAEYKWSDSKGTGSLPLNFELVASEALSADYWLNVGYVDSKKDIVAKDVRYGAFRSFQTGNVYNNNLRTNEIGSNDYWESGAMNPQIVLADMIKILHPDLLPKHELRYYKQLK